MSGRLLSILGDFMTPLAYDANNPFKAAVVESEKLPEKTAEFQARLQYSLEHWQAEKLRLVWLRIPAEKSHLIPMAVTAGFTFHHCQPDYLLLSYRLVPNVTIPGFATHFIGVGGVVLNERQELLVIVEQHAARSGRSESFKIPGGALLAGEHISEGASREVFEETGIETAFEKLVCFRHWHGYRYGQSDIYFVCRLTPLTQTIIKQESEIFDARWMPIEEFLTRDSVSEFHKGIVRAALNGPTNGSGLIPGWLAGYNQDRVTREIFIQ
jgi:8-oxo-dGTP pyrophosphatase MutT (NUDIX family)